MKRALFLFLPLLIVGPAAAQQAAAPPVAVSYTLDVTDPKSGTARVEMQVENNRDDEVTLGLPVWEPGRYRVVAFHLGLKDLEAEVSGRKVEVTPTEHKSVWKLKTGGAAKFTVRYTLKPGEVPQLKGQFNENHYDLLGPSAWVYIKDRMNGPHRVTFKLPEGWKAASGLRRVADHTYEERDYDTFADCPIELGTFDQYAFEHEGVAYEIVVHATEAVAEKRLIDIHKKIVAEQTRMFGGAPFDRYVFLYHFSPMPGGNGLEHLNSTRIHYSLAAVKSDPAHLASIASHEFFHLWNVKRIRPKELGPFDYTQPVRTKALWFSEGVTSYYGDLTLARSGIWTREQYLDHLAAEMTSLQLNPARQTQTVEQASWTVWDRSRGDRTPAVDYYNKGELLGWLLDLSIRQATQGKQSFDDVMRLLYRRGVVEASKAGKGPIGVGFEEDGVLKAVNEISGKDFTGFFRDYVSGTEELPYETIAQVAGLAVSRQKTIGVVLRNMTVRFEPPRDSAARAAGIKRGDKVVKINDTAVASPEELRKVLEPFNLREKVTVHLTREGRKDPVLAEVPVVEGGYDLKVRSDATSEQDRHLKSWLAPSK